MTLRLDAIKDGRAGRVIIDVEHGCHITFTVGDGKTLYGATSFHASKPISFEYFESKNKVFLTTTSMPAEHSVVASVTTNGNQQTITVNPALSLLAGEVVSQNGYLIGTATTDNPDGATTFTIDVIGTTDSQGQVKTIEVTPPAHTAVEQGGWITAMS